MKLIQALLEQKKILVPRRSKEERAKNYSLIVQKKIQQYIKDGSKGNLDLRGTPITSLPDNLKYVGGDLNLYKSKITSLPDNLEYVGGDLKLLNSEIKSLPDNLKHVGGDLDLTGSKIKSLPDNLKVGRSLWISFTSIKSLPNNLKVEKNLIIRDTPLDYNYDDIDIKDMTPNIKGTIYR